MSPWFKTLHAYSNWAGYSPVPATAYHILTYELLYFWVPFFAIKLRL